MTENMEPGPLGGSIGGRGGEMITLASADVAGLAMRRGGPDRPRAGRLSGASADRAACCRPPRARDPRSAGRELDGAERSPRLPLPNACRSPPLLGAGRPALAAVVSVTRTPVSPMPARKSSDTAARSERVQRRPTHRSQRSQRSTRFDEQGAQGRSGAAQRRVAACSRGVQRVLE